MGKKEGEHWQKGGWCKCVCLLLQDLVLYASPPDEIGRGRLKQTKSEID